jgi:hypothetical protein
LSLTDWRSVTELKDAVGQGLYTAVINLPAPWFGADAVTHSSVGSDWTRYADQRGPRAPDRGASVTGSHLDVLIYGL